MTDEYAEGTAAGAITDDGTSTFSKGAPKSQKVSITGDSDEDDFSYEDKVLPLLHSKSGRSKLS